MISWVRFNEKEPDLHDGNTYLIHYKICNEWFMSTSNDCPYGASTLAKMDDAWWMKVEDETEIGVTLDIGCLTYKFGHGFLWRAKDHELCGFNPDTLTGICIDDGICVKYGIINHEYNEEPGWMYHSYKLKDKESGYAWISSETGHWIDNADFVESVEESFIKAIELR